MKEKLAEVPKKPGVYIFKGNKDRVLYIGKAIKLRNRLKTYFHRPDSLDPRKRAMVKLVTDFSYIITKNELEALILEANLIKQHRPKFNIILRDDKNFPYLKLTMNDPWPYLTVARRVVNDGSLYFGPYVPAQSMWDTLSFIRKNFPIRSCKYDLAKHTRLCIQYQMGRCSGPCGGKTSREDYLKSIQDVRLFLSGSRKDLIKNLEQKMAQLSDELRFEEAAQVRDRIAHIRQAWESQRVVIPELGDLDAIGFYADDADAVVNVFFVRKGLLIGASEFSLKGAGSLPAGEVLHSFIEMFYMKEILVPPEILVPRKPDAVLNLRKWLGQKRGGKVSITVPAQGKKRELLKMASDNAFQFFTIRKGKAAPDLPKMLQDILSLPFAPVSVGAFDVSTITGSEPVGAFVYWEEGEFIQNRFRHFRVKGVPGINDYAMMSEIMTRTFDNLADSIPRLLLIDGGKGHLETAQKVLEQHKVATPDGTAPAIAAIAKKPDRLFLPTAEVLLLDSKNPAHLLLRRIRDEVHRFAISYHRKLRKQRTMVSPLEKIPGIGKKRRLALLRHFDSIESMRNATIDDLMKVRGFSRTIAGRLLEGLRRQT